MEDTYMCSYKNSYIADISMSGRPFMQPDFQQAQRIPTPLISQGNQNRIVVYCLIIFTGTCSQHARQKTTARRFSVISKLVAVAGHSPC